MAIKLTAAACYGHGGKQFVARIVGRDKRMTFSREFLGKKGGKRGEFTEVLADEPGLYQTRDIDSKGRDKDAYHLVIDRGQDDLGHWRIEKDEAMKVAKELDGRRFEDVVEYLPPVEANVLHQMKASLRLLEAEWDKGCGEDPHAEVRHGGLTMTHGDRQLRRAASIADLKAQVERRAAAGEVERLAESEGWDFRTAKQAAKAKAAATEEAAYLDCLGVLAALPLAVQAKVAARLKKGLTPAKAKPETAAAE